MRIREGAAGYGVYMMILETLRDAEGRTMFYFPEGLSFAINEPDIDLVQRVCEKYDLFKFDDNGNISSPWLDAQMAEYDAKKAAAAEAGRRGAAKRYGKRLPDESANSDPIAPPKGSLKDTNSNKPNPNITLSDDINSINSKSRLLGMSVGRWSGEELFLIARQKGTAISDLDREEVAIRSAQELAKEVQEFNPDYVLEIADTMRFSHEQYEVLSFMLEGGKIGTKRTAEAIRILNDWKGNKFRAKFPFEFLICKLAEL